MKGKLIVIEGLDGSGKATQTALLCEKLKTMGVEYDHFSFPDYKNESSLLVRMYLDGKFGDNADQVNPYAASCFFACDRYASFRTQWQDKYEGGRVIVCDRYTTSNAVHQCSKLPSGDWDNFINWLFDFEYNKIGLPEPDAVIYLRVDPEIGQELLKHRYNGDEKKKDIHEKDEDHLRRSRLTADHCAEVCGWHTIECVDENGMRDKQEIAEEVFEAVRSVIKNK